MSIRRPWPAALPEPAVEGNLDDFEAPAPPGKSAGDQKLDQLNPQRKDHEQRAGARRKTIAMSENAEGAAGGDAPQKTTTMSDAVNFTASAGPSKAPPTTSVENNGGDHAARLRALFAGNQVEHVFYSDPEPERHGRNGVKFKPRYTTVPGAATVEHWRQHLAGNRPLGIIPIREDNCAALVRLTSTSTTPIRCSLSRRSRAQGCRLCLRGPSPAACT